MPVDRCDLLGIFGWMLDFKLPDRRSVIDLYINHCFKDSIICNESRRDLVEKKIGGDGCVAFNYYFDDNIKKLSSFNVTLIDNKTKKILFTKKITNRQPNIKLVMTLLVRDEIDIITQNIEYHRNIGVDHFIVTDNMSQDGTTEVLREYEKRGILTYIEETSLNYEQRKWVTRMARMAKSEFNADWVINADADEFFVTKSCPLKDVLEKIKDSNFIQVPMYNFQTVEMNPTDNPIQKMFYKETLLQPLPKTIHRGDELINVTMGNHFAKSENLSPKFINSNNIEIFHFPIRSYKQYELKIRNVVTSIEKNPEFGLNVGAHSRAKYALLKENKLYEDFSNKILLNTEKIQKGIANKLIVPDFYICDVFDYMKFDELSNS